MDFPDAIVPLLPAPFYLVSIYGKIAPEETVFMNILVTGAAGFIGSHLVERLLADDHVVFGFDNFDPYYERRIKERNISSAGHDRRFRFFEGTIRDARAPAQVFGTAAEMGYSIDAVVHLAAKAGVRPSIEDPVGYTKVNVEGTVNLMEAMVAADVKNLVLASSSSVYGNSETIPFREDQNVDYPISPYAATKKACELLTHTYAHLHGMRVAALRFFTVYGPRQRPDLAIAKFTHLIEKGKRIPLYGDGSTKRDYTYIDDTIDGVIGAIAWVEDQPGGAYRIFNLGESHTVSLADLVSILEESLGKSAEIDRQPNQPGDVRATYADVARARDELGYDPHVSIKEGIKRYVDWYRTEDLYRKGKREWQRRSL